MPKVRLEDILNEGERPQRPRTQKPKPRVTTMEEMKPKKKDTWIGVNKKQRW